MMSFPPWKPKILEASYKTCSTAKTLLNYIEFYHKNFIKSSERDKVWIFGSQVILQT